MSVSVVRLEKEVRPLMGVWAALILIGFVLIAIPKGVLGFSWDALLLGRLAGFWIGLPLVATLSMGHEFHYGTAPLLLAQPMDRRQIWREKWIALLPMVAFVAFLYLLTGRGLGFPVDAYHLDGKAGVLGVVWLIIATASAPFWTLVGRSVLNGLVLNLIQGFVLFQIWQWAEFAAGYLLRPEAFLVVIFAGIAYASIMLWFGYRKFVRFEVDTGSMSADVLIPGFKGADRFSGIFLSRPNQPLLNLVRKELRLLWVVWLLTAISVVGVICLAALQFAPGYSLDRVGILVAGFVASISLLSSILAGSLSMGEERSTTTRSWHQTLPISAARQWIVKLGVVLAGAFIAAALPVAVATLVIGKGLAVPYGLGFPNQNLLFILLFSSILSFTGFWCGCLVKGTIRAALLTLPVLVLIFAGIRVILNLIYVLHFMANLLDSLVLRFHPFPFSGEPGYLGPARNWLIALPLHFADFQSYRLFQTDAHERLVHVLRSLFRVVGAAIVSAAVVTLPSAIQSRAAQLSFYGVMQVDEAVRRMPNLIPAEGGIQLTLQDLSIPDLSPSSRVILRDAVVSVERDRRVRRGVVTSVRFRNGLSCSFARGWSCKPEPGK